MVNKILIVDDEPAVDLLMRQIFRKEIRNGHYELAFAKDGVAALEQLASNSEIEVVITDINMPGMDGLTLLNHLHQDFPLVKVVMVSAYSDSEKVETARRGGAFEFINKPVKVQDVKDTVKKALGAFS